MTPAAASCRIRAAAIHGARLEDAADGIVAHMPVREPYNADWVFPFLAARAIPGLESVADGVYRRRLTNGALVAVERVVGNLRISIPAAASADAADILTRLHGLFDLTADSSAIDRHLATEPLLASLVRMAPGIRVPGVWDPFEGAVRAVLGQQVSVRQATVLAQRLCERFGAGAFPAADVLAQADVAAIGMTGTRGAAVSAIARQVVANGDAWLTDATALRQAFAKIRGLGPWTTEYAAMRVAGDGDAFPDSDWGVWKALGVKGAAARRWAEPCRPWRAYATMQLWRSRSQDSATLADRGEAAVQRHREL